MHPVCHDAKLCITVRLPFLCCKVLPVHFVSAAKVDVEVLYVRTELQHELNYVVVVSKL